MNRKPELQDFNLDERIVSFITSVDLRIENRIKDVQKFLYLVAYLLMYLFVSFFWVQQFNFKTAFLTLYPGFLVWYLLALFFIESKSGVHFFDKYRLKLKKRYFKKFNLEINEHENYLTKYYEYKASLKKHKEIEAENKMLAVLKKTKEYTVPLDTIIENLKYKKDYEYIFGAFSEYRIKLDNYLAYLEDGEALKYKIANKDYYNSKIGWIQDKLNKNVEIKDIISQNTQKKEEESKVKKSNANEIITINEVHNNIEDKIEILSSSEVFNETPNKKKTINVPRSALKIDFNETNIKNSNLGLLGEEFIVQQEKKKLIELKRNDLANRVEHVSKEKGDGLGYDIISFDDTGQEIWIEVKTTTGDIASQFFISNNELNVLNSYSNYFIYRVFDFDIENKKGKIFKIKGKEEIEKYFDIEPTNYKIIPRMM